MTDPFLQLELFTVGILVGLAVARMVWLMRR
jgi:hypothetical protein